MAILGTWSGIEGIDIFIGNHAIDTFARWAIPPPLYILTIVEA